jgi:uncharacterized protein YcfJ
MKTILRSTLIVASLAIATAPLAFAQNSAPGYDFARVISSQPLYETVEVDQGREVFRTERVHHAVPEYSAGYYEAPRSEAASVFGAIIGGVIGNQFGRGRGRTAATVAGAALGAAVVNDGQRQDRYRRGYQGTRTVVRNERICSYEPNVRRERQLVGYTVRYDYKGQIGETTTRNQPGSTIRVQVDVTPIED